MFSIIICSISPERLQSLEINISQTIGVEYEIIAIDNGERKWPIAKAYNYGASLAKYSNLLFLHEDVSFHSEKWGEFIESKLVEPDCGIIGFVGGKIMLNSYSGWNQYYEWVCCYLYQNAVGLSRFDVCNAYLQRPFEEVVTVDGLAMFVRKEVWRQFPFDENILQGFHCYDIDFSLQVFSSKFYKNYICCSNRVLLEHFSSGTYNEQWFSETVRLYKNKWNKLLPFAVEGWHIGDKERKKHEERLSYEFLKGILKSSSPYKKVVLKEFWQRPFNWKHFRRCVACTFKYLIRTGSN